MAHSTSSYLNHQASRELLTTSRHCHFGEYGSYLSEHVVNRIQSSGHLRQMNPGDGLLGREAVDPGIADRRQVAAVSTSDASYLYVPLMSFYSSSLARARLRPLKRGPYMLNSTGIGIIAAKMQPISVPAH